MNDFGRIWTVSNGLSFLRLLLAFPFWYLISNLSAGNNRWYAIALCFFAAFTDVMDGFLARKLNQVTEMGKIIDPLADKVCVAVIAIAFYTYGLIDPFFFWLVIGRDLLIFTAGIFITRKLKRVLPSNLLGKLTVVTICFLIIAILAGTDPYSAVYLTLYYLSIVMIFASLAGYFIRSLEFLKQAQHETL